MKALSWAQQQARVAQKEAHSYWGKGWNLLSAQQKEAALSQEVVRLMVSQCGRTLEQNPALVDLIETWRELIRLEFPRE